MRFSNLHTHTTFSDGKNSPREVVESAIAKNMLSLGFSDHSFTACDPSYCMMLEDYPSYREEILSLKKEYEDRIPIFLGIEKDYFSEIDRSQFDYVIGSVHYIIRDGVCYPIDHTRAQQESCVNDAFGGSVLDMSRCYFDMVAEHTMMARPDVVGHFDVINKFSYMPECEDVFIRIAEEALRECLKWCKRFEVNTGGIARGWRKTPYPNMHLLKLIREGGGEIVLNSDSHTAENLDFFFPEAVDYIRAAGFDTISYLTNGGFAKMKI